MRPFHGVGKIVDQGLGIGDRIVDLAREMSGQMRKVRVEPFDDELGMLA